MKVVVPIAPRAKPRPRFAVRGRGKRQFVQSYTPEQYMKYEATFKAHVDAWMAEKCRTSTKEPLVFLTKFYTADRRKRDLDNMLKGLDALHDVVFENDNQIKIHVAEKLYDKEHPRIELEVYYYKDFQVGKAEILADWFIYQETAIYEDDEENPEEDDA